MQQKSTRTQKTITIKDIAHIAKVSHTTVSRALSNNPLITEKQRMRIKRIAKKMGYIPNLSARSLVRKRSYTVGLFFSSIGSHITPDFYYQATTILHKAVKDQYNLVIRGIDDYKGDFSTIAPQFFDGVMLVSQTISDDTFIQYLIHQSIPFVLVNRRHSDDAIDCFYADERKAIYQLVLRLASTGHRRIAFLRGPKGRISTNERYSGFLDAVRALSLSKEGLIFDGDYTFTSGYVAGQRIVQQNPLPDAVICSNDNMAIGLIKAFADEGIKVPDSISVTGFDGSDTSKYLTPSLYTIKRPIEDIVFAAAQRLLDKISKSRIDTVSCKICFDCEIIEGGTVISRV